jgi:hypothetical protein
MLKTLLVACWAGNSSMVSKPLEQYERRMINNRNGKAISLKSLLPYENYIIESKLSVDALRARLLRSIETQPTTLYEAVSRYHEKPYEGTFYANEFKIKRITSYSNPFLPVVSGYMVDKIEGTAIYIKMRSNKYKMILWYSFLMVFFIVGYTASPFFEGMGTEKNTFLGEGFGFGVIVLTFTIVPVILFKVESSKAKHFLATVFEVVQ